MLSEVSTLTINTEPSTLGSSQTPSPAPGNLCALIWEPFLILCKAGVWSRGSQCLAAPKPSPAGVLLQLLLLIELMCHELWPGHCSSLAACVKSFNPPNHTLSKDNKHHCIGGETESCQKSHRKTQQGGNLSLV